MLGRSCISVHLRAFEDQSFGSQEAWGGLQAAPRSTALAPGRPCTFVWRRQWNRWSSPERAMLRAPFLFGAFRERSFAGGESGQRSGVESVPGAFAGSTRFAPLGEALVVRRAG